MKQLDLTLPSPAENLALDEALVETADVDDTHSEMLRLWEPRETFVVIGSCLLYTSPSPRDRG